MSNVSESKFNEVASDAQFAFWAIVAERFPEATTGDLSPAMSHKLDCVMGEALTEWIDNNLAEVIIKNHEILQHNIEHWMHGTDMEMTEDDYDHIKNMIIGGYDQGELRGLDEDDKSHRGWWNINNK